ncbi:hypothetical protein AN217_06435 [Streptomyces qinglanensis]|uniref:Uncharacterized protein n=1 Tax=Streptomyces qinglanensis TaxID=943816 RepID=A0A1E7K129_9ACTN|nr:hypothetical protein AN217_06435 [Streptomyces qinglanensis]
MTEVSSLTGRLLVATPVLADPNFDRAVVLLLDHDEEGSLGVVLNRPTPVDVSDILEPWAALAGEPGVVFQGGPVSLDAALGVAVVPSGRGDRSDGDPAPGADGAPSRPAGPAPDTPRAGRTREDGPATESQDRPGGRPREPDAPGTAESTGAEAAPAAGSGATADTGTAGRQPTGEPGSAEREATGGPGTGGRGTTGDRAAGDRGPTGDSGADDRGRRQPHERGPAGGTEPVGEGGTDAEADAEHGDAGSETDTVLDTDGPLGWRRVHGAIGLVDLEAPPELLAAELGSLRIFAGYAGWGPGQLEKELSEGAWYVVESEPGDVSSPAPERLWRSVLRRQRSELALVATYPDDPSLN